LFRIEKVSRGWSFWSVTRTSFLCCSCFFLLLVEVGLLLDRGEVGGNKEEEEEEEEEEGREDVEGRPFFSLSA
jgi:hypothetical protein